MCTCSIVLFPFSESVLLNLLFLQLVSCVHVYKNYCCSAVFLKIDKIMSLCQIGAVLAGNPNNLSACAWDVKHNLDIPRTGSQTYKQNGGM